MRFPVLMMLLLLPSMVLGAVYKWVDKHGRVHYGDRPPVSAMPASLPEIQVISPAPKTPAQPSATKTAPAGADLSTCLSQKGFVFYGASWCPQCTLQKRMFGRSASNLPYVECAIDGTRERTPTCASMGIKAYPTWVFPDGSRRAGVYSQKNLALISGCG